MTYYYLDILRIRFGTQLRGEIYTGVNGKFNRYNYNTKSYQLIIYILINIYKIFIIYIEDIIYNQLKII